MLLVSTKRDIAEQMLLESGEDFSCPHCLQEMVPEEALTQLGGEGTVYLKCENGHEKHFPISYAQAGLLGLHWEKDLPEASG